MKPLPSICISAIAALCVSASLQASQAAEINVVSSIKPVHSLVSAVLGKTGNSSLLIQGSDTPHSISFRPSQAKELEAADVIFWIGPEIETFLEKPLESLAGGAKVVTLEDTKGLIRQEVREGGSFEGHGHHDDHDDHDEDKHGDHDGHDDHELDAHIWLDPQNASLMVSEIAHVLGEVDPTNAGQYAANAKLTQTRLTALGVEIAALLEPVKGKPYIVFHDAYQAFESRFGITAIGSLTINPQVKPGAERVDEIQKKIGSLSAACVFAEPQFKSTLIDVIVEGTTAKQGALDPIGATIEDGPELYFTLMRNMASAFHDCLQG